MLLNMVIKYGRLKSVIFIALINIAASVLVTRLIFYLMEQPMPLIIAYLSVIIPGTLASAGPWYSIGLILKIHRLEQKVRKLANYDSLTSVMSRAAFLNMAEAIYQVMTRNRSPLAFLYIDIDDFKKINDTCTHAGGDAVLKNFGSIILSQIRKSDIAGRLGGEEFAILLANTDRKGGVYFAEKFRKTINDVTAPYQDKNIQYTVSIGLSIFDRNNRISLDKLIGRADAALYSAKNSGKNRVVTCDSDSGINQIRIQAP